MKDRIMRGLAVATLAAMMLPVTASADGHIDVLEDVATVVAVKNQATTLDWPAASLSRADCDVLVRVVAEDGSSQEFQSCLLSDEPVMIPENQGMAPAETITDSGGECVWSSDYHFSTSDTDVKASGFEVVVMPSGRVFAWSSYPAEPLECPEE